MTHKKGHELVFLCRILPDGSGVEAIPEAKQRVAHTSGFYNEEFTLHRLSLTQQTFIAHAMSSYIVKLKDKDLGCPFDENLTTENLPLA